MEPCDERQPRQAPHTVTASVMESNGGRGYEARALVLDVNNNDDRFNVNADDNINNDRPARGMTPPGPQGGFSLANALNIWERLCSFENLKMAYEKARRGKTQYPAVQEFEEHREYHLYALRRELRSGSYAPRPLRTFVLRDPKTRVISKSDFRDRVVHHALVDVLAPVFEPQFISDSHASRKGKGVLSALARFDRFARQVTRNGTLVPDARCANDVVGYALKCDIRHYFDTVDHGVLLGILRKRVYDARVLALARLILEHHRGDVLGKGMPLGNWTSQFFANAYLNELDQFVKHTLRTRCYIRYVDDFVILSRSKTLLAQHRERIDAFLRERLLLSLHPDKCQIIPLKRGVPFLGFRVFYRYKLVRERNWRRIRQKVRLLLDEYEENEADADVVLNVLRGWCAYAMHGNTYGIRQRLEDAVLSELVRRRDARKRNREWQERQRGN